MDKEWFKLLSIYNYPSDYQINIIHNLMDKGITDKWKIEEELNNKFNKNPIIIDFIEYEMQLYKRSKR